MAKAAARRGHDARRAVVDEALLASVVDGDRVTLPDDVAHYFTRVLRLKDGERVVLLDGRGRVVEGSFSAASPPSVCDVRAVLVDDPLPPLVVFQALVRGAKLDEVVQRATELGASEVVVYRATRSVVPDAQVRLARLAKIADDATRQAQRARAPKIDGVLEAAALKARIAGFAGVAVVGDPRAERPLVEVLRAAPTFAAHGMAVVIGPEGGLTDDELAALREVGAIPTRLGAHVLRTETAALAALAAAQCALGQL